MRSPPLFPAPLRARLPLFLFLLLYALFVLFTYRDFGVAWDEYDVYSRGDALFRYLFGRGFDPAYFSTYDGKVDTWVLDDYWYPMLLSLGVHGFSIETFHLLNFLAALLVFILSYELLYRHYGRALFALAGPLFLFFTPRFLGHVPIVPRDLSFAVAYFASLGALYLLHARQGAAKVLALGLLFGMAQSSRLVGLSLYPLWALYAGWDLRRGGKADARAFVRLGVEMAGVFAVSLFFMLATWPYLRTDFLRRSLQVLLASSHFPWVGNFLFMGRMVQATDLPWYYLPGWVLVSSPLFVLFFLGFIPWSVKDAFRNRLFVFLVMALGLNLGLILLLRPVVYLGMRHFLYLVPLLTLLAALSAIELWSRLKGRARHALALFLLADLALVGSQMVRLHPYEYIYFNELTGGLPGAYGRFEIEDRAISTKEALAWLTKERLGDGKGRLVASYQDPFQVIYHLPPPSKFTEDRAKADYLLCQPFDGRHQLRSRLLYSVEREGVPLMDLYEK